jgi:hypothetical protein
MKAFNDPEAFLKTSENLIWLSQVQNFIANKAMSMQANVISIL